MPVLLIMIMIHFFGAKKNWINDIVTIFPFAIFSALCFTVPYLITAIFLGPEFPSIFGGLFGMATVTLAVKCNFLVPKDIWKFEERSKWPKHWLGNVNMELKNNNKKKDW